MSDQRIIRFPNITASLGVDRLDYCRKLVVRDLERLDLEPKKQNSLAHSYKLLAISQWAFGYPASAVAELLKKSTAAYLHTLQMRGTATYSHTEYHRGIAGETKTIVSWHNGNSWDSFEAAESALIAGEVEHARTIAEKIWDPPDAEYIIRGAESCTPEHQKVAYAFRDIYLNRNIESLSELRRISLLWKARKFSKTLAYTAGALVGVYTADAKTAFNALQDLIWWYQHEAGKESVHDDILFVEPLGLAAFLIARALVTIEQLPQDDVRFPVELLRVAFNQPA